MPVPALALSALSSFAPALLGHLFGDPAKKYRQKVAKITSPLNQSRLTNQFYQQLLQSPAFSQSQGLIAGGANQASNQIGSSLAQRGIGTSGVGSILPGLVSSMVGQQQAQLRTSTHQSAQDQAQQAIQAQLAALTGSSVNSQGGMIPGQTNQLFAGGLEAFLPYLRQFLQGQGGGGGGGAANPMGSPGFQWPR